MTDQAEGLREVIAGQLRGLAPVLDSQRQCELRAGSILVAVNEYVSAHLDDAIDAGLKVLDTMPDDPHRDFCIAFLAALGFTDRGEER